jgi:hypothetical protein
MSRYFFDNDRDKEVDPEQIGSSNLIAVVFESICDESEYLFLGGVRRVFELMKF